MNEDINYLKDILSLNPKEYILIYCDNDFLELNRLVCIDDTPKNTESRFISICLLLIKRNAPQVKWVMSFADATQVYKITVESSNHTS